MSTDSPPDSLLSPLQVQLLQRLLDGPNVCGHNPPHAALQELADRGYITFRKALCGPLSIPTGEIMAEFTEAGRIAFDCLQKHPCK